MKKKDKEILSSYSICTEDARVKAVLTSSIKSESTSCSTGWVLTDHCLERLKERSISHRHLLMALEYGEAHFKQGMTFFVVTSKNLPKNLTSFDRYKLENMVVVVSADAAIITCYKSPNGLKHIKKKRKNLWKCSSEDSNVLN